MVMTTRRDAPLATPVLTIVGHVESSLMALGDAPRQADEGAPPAVLVIDPRFAPALAGLSEGDAVILLTWLHLADRDVLATHPRGDTTRDPTGVFSTRSPHRPNPIGLHHVRVVRLSGNRVHVDSLEAIDGTPVLDLKPVLAEAVGDR